MRDRGDITQDEYEGIKADLLNEMDQASHAALSDPTPSYQPQSAPSQTTTALSIDSQTRWWLIGTGVLMAVGTFLAWVQAGIISVAGTDGDGIFTLIGGVIVALVGVANRASIITGLGTLIVAGFSMWIVINIFGNFDTVDIGSIGSGLYLTGLASLFAAISGLKVFGEARR